VSREAGTRSRAATHSTATRAALVKTSIRKTKTEGETILVSPTAQLEKLDPPPLLLVGVVHLVGPEHRLYLLKPL
jgi:hypothetical protein